jgi:ribosomal-protein-serine acetyltransferase
MELPNHKSLIPLFEELRGQKVVVRPYRLEDAEALFEAVVESRQHIWPWLPWGDSHQTVDDSRDFILRSQAKWLLREEDLTVGVFDAGSGRYLGGSGLHVRGWDIPAFEIGYWIRASAEGHGYISEAVQLLTDFAFASLGARRVMIRCDARNVRSAAVAERLGFVREARLRNDGVSADGTVRDTLIFSRTPDDPRWPTN